MCTMVYNEKKSNIINCYYDRIKLKIIHDIVKKEKECWFHSENIQKK